MASPAAATPLRRTSASGPYRPLCSALDAPRSSRFRREQRTEAWKTDLAKTLLGALPPSFPGAATAATLLAGGRRESTWGSYSGKLQRFIDFCQLIVPQFGLPPVRALPARPDYIAAYIGYLRDEGLVHANSLQPYLSCINQWHADMGLDKPAVGHLIQRLRRGFGEAEGNDAEGELVASRRPIPAPIMLQVLHLARNSRRDHSQRGRLLRRAATASVLAFSFMLRGDSLVQLRRQDVTVSPDGIVIRIRVKTRGRTVATTVHRPSCDEVYNLIRDWIEDFQAPDSALLSPLRRRDGRAFYRRQLACDCAFWRLG